ncbi:MAG TPA: oxygenase MpaB family protein [Mucilaginibacter sp.]|jgi:hypothetical protein|nr:oxygenase MpaB family protein [Mucilaginibacter sp.]
MKENFVSDNSIVRKIWGRADTVLFIFAGAAAEFALNKAVDWLYFTGRLPADPIGRLFSTVAYARQIIFSERDDAMRAIDKITAIHNNVEAARGANIPDWAYRDVLFMLIDYSIRSFELLDRKLTLSEKDEVFNVFYRVGLRMNLTGLPNGYDKWEIMRETHLAEDLVYSTFTKDLYKQYKKRLGPIRYPVLKKVQMRLIPEKVKKQLNLRGIQWVRPLLGLYKLLRKINLEGLFKNILLPPAYKQQILLLDRAGS